MLKWKKKKLSEIKRRRERNTDRRWRWGGRREKKRGRMRSVRAFNHIPTGYKNMRSSELSPREEAKEDSRRQICIRPGEQQVRLNPWKGILLGGGEREEEGLAKEYLKLYNRTPGTIPNAF